MSGIGAKYEVMWGLQVVLQDRAILEEVLRHRKALRPWQSFLLFHGSQRSLKGKETKTMQHPIFSFWQCTKAHFRKNLLNTYQFSHRNLKILSPTTQLQHNNLWYIGFYCNIVIFHCSTEHNLEFVIIGPVSDDEWSIAFIQKLSLLTGKMFLNTLFLPSKGQESRL